MRTMLAVLLSSGFLAACGGGGGSPGGTAAPLLVINASNQQAVGRATAMASTALVGAGGGVSTGAATDGNASALSVSGTATSRPGTSIASMAMYLAHSLSDATDAKRTTLAAGRSGGSARTLTVAPSTTACSVSGTLTISLVDADNSGTATVGDTMTLTFDHCHETATESITGAMSITLGSVNVVSGRLNFNGTLAMQALTVTDGTRTSALNGSLSMAYNEASATQTQIVMTVGSSGLAASVSGGGMSDAVSFDAGFVLNVTDTLAATPSDVDTTTATLNGSFSTTAIGGRVQLATSVPLLQLASENYPRAGVMRAVGSGSALRMTVLDATTVRLELDANLDGTYEASADLPWAMLLPG